MNDSLEIAGRSAAVLALAESLASEIVLGQFQQERRFVLLGKAVLEIRTQSFWKNAGFGSFGKYIQHLSSVVNRERSTLYGYTATVESLLPVVGEDNLSAMGINKALVLAAGMKYTGRVPSEDLVNKATNPDTTAEELKSAVNTEFRLFLPEGDSKWRTFGFYADDSEWAEIQQAVETAKREDPPISNTLPEHEQLKESLLRLAQEFTAEYGVKTK